MLKIAISGKMYSGKSTAARYIEEQYGARVISFARELKERLASIGVHRETLYSTKPEKVRKLMQLYGQVMRDQDPNIWVKLALLDIIENPAEIVVIDDLRFTNEARMLREAGFKLIRVVRDDPQYNMDFDAPDLSEIDLDQWLDWDMIIHAQSGDLHALLAPLDSFIRIYKG